MEAPWRWSWGDPPQELATLLGRGGIVAVPTESSYGLAALPRGRGVARIFSIKSRAANVPLPVVAASLGQISALGVDRREPALRLLAEVWPAPLSVVLPLAEPIAASAGRPSLAVRIPAHPRLCALLEALGTALTATSANRSGAPAIVDPAELPPLLAGRLAAWVDDGRLPGGPPSTLVALEDDRWRVLRQGAYPIGDLPPVRD